MSDLLALLDQVIDGLTSRAFRDRAGTGMSAGTSKSLDKKTFPAVPVPDRGAFAATSRSKTTDCGGQQGSREAPYSNTSGITGSAGSPEHSGGFASFHDTGFHGYGGNCRDEGGSASSSRSGGPRPLPLPDGRQMHAVAVSEVPQSVSEHIAGLVERARNHGGVVVADGCELKIVEPQDRLPKEIMEALRDEAGVVIAVLRGESRARCGAYGHHQ
jgi:hypothetical protein